MLFRSTSVCAEQVGLVLGRTQSLCGGHGAVDRRNGEVPTGFQTTRVRIATDLLQIERALARLRAITTKTAQLAGIMLCLNYPLTLQADAGSTRFQVVEVPSGTEEDRSLCQALVRDLNSFPSSVSMVCERKHNLQSKRLEKPIWREWSREEIEKRFDLIKEFYEKYHQPPHQMEPAAIKRILDAAKRGDFKVQEATIPTLAFGMRRWIRWGNPSLEKARADRKSLGIEEQDISLTYSDDCSWETYVTLTPDGRGLQMSIPGGVATPGSGTLDIWIWVGPDGVRDSFNEAWTRVSKGFSRAELSIDTNRCRIAYRKQP